MSPKRLALLLLSAALLLPGCSRTGTVAGQIIAEPSPGPAKGVPRAAVWIIPASETFEREWQRVLDGSREAIRPALEQQRAAEQLAEQARRTWDRAVATQGASGVSLTQWNRSAVGRRWERDLWAQVQRASAAAFEARQRVLRVLSGHSQQAESVLAQYASREVVSDEGGRYVITKLRPGKAYLFARLRLADRDVTWFRLIEVRTGMQQFDLFERQAGGWPFAPGP